MSAMKFRESDQVLWRGVRPAHNGIQVIKTCRSEDATFILHTVNDDVTFFLTYAFIGMWSNPGVIDIAYRDAADLNYVRFLTNSIGTNVGGIPSSVFSLQYPIEIPEKYDIIAIPSAINLTYNATIHGWEE